MKTEELEYFHAKALKQEGTIFSFPDDEIITVFKLTEKDLKKFPNLKDGCSEYYAIQTMHGILAHCGTLTDEEYKATIYECELSDDYRANIK